MTMNTNTLNLASDIPKLDLSRNVENKENINKAIIDVNLEKFSSLQELFQHIMQSIENNLRQFLFELFYLLHNLETQMIQLCEKLYYITYLQQSAILNTRNMSFSNLYIV